MAVGRSRREARVHVSMIILYIDPVSGSLLLQSLVAGFLAALSFPYEWTVSMIADAGLATLEVQDRALDAQASLKDATAFNVQFVAGRPVFIDLGSFERPARLDVWFALGQFNQMFVFPL